MVTLGLIKTNWRHKNEKQQSLYLLFWTLFPFFLVFLISFFKSLFLPRYFIFSSVGLTILIIYSLEKIKVLPRFLFFLLLIFVSFNYQQLEVKYRKKIDFSQSIKKIKALARPYDLIYVTSELDFHTAEYYFDEHRVFIFGKKYEIIPDYVGKILIPKEKIASALPVFPKKAFILKRDASYEIVSAN